MAKRQGPQSFAKRQRERMKQAKQIEKVERRRERKKARDAAEESGVKPDPEAAYIDPPTD